MSKKRIFLIVLDSFGIGGASDAEQFGDYGANTLKSIFTSKNFSAPNLAKLGLFDIDGNNFLSVGNSPIASYARMKEKSKGKDTIIGHWEMMGVISEREMPTFPNGFPSEFIENFEQATQRKIICNKPYSGTKVLEDFGEEHLRTGALICYTSADSVFQIAAHEDIVSVAELYKYCEIARDMLKDELAVGRVIARPFVGTNKADFKRTANRHDYALAPPHETTLDTLKNSGKDVIGVGKIYDIFNGQGITETHKTQSNADGMCITAELANHSFNGLCFVNLVDFDMVYGHRRDIDGYAKAISEFDNFLGEFLPKLSAKDLLIITADHGCDPAFVKTTDHTREDVPLIVYDPENNNAQNFGEVQGFDTVGDIILKNLI